MMLGIEPALEEPVAEGSVSCRTDIIIPGIAGPRRNQHQRQRTSNNEG
jgi:hypothetical protein